MFHRLTAPSYFGGLPGGYDYINNLLVGTPAFADGPKVGGPNAGTYFIAFGEDATSSNFNRAHAALAENTDFIDDLLRRDMAVSARTNSALAGAPVSSLVLTGPGIFLGGVGATLKDLFRVVTSTGDNIVDPATGTQCIIDAIDAGGALGGGFSAGNVTISIDPPIPAGVTWRAVYGVRSDLASAAAAALTSGIRSDNDFGAALWNLQAGGLDARYRRSPTGATGALGVAGSGGTFFRDGPSMQGYGQKDLTGSTSYTAGVGSWLEALWLADNRDFGGDEPSGGENPFPPVTPPNNDRFGGTTSGFVYLGHQRFSYKLAETATHRAPGFASFFHGAKHYDDGVADGDMRTWLPAGSVVDVTGNAVTVVGPAYFRNAGGVSAIALGYDLIDLDFGDGIVRSFVLTGFTSDLIATVRNLDNSIPNVPAATPATIVRWIRTRFGVFDGAKEARQGFTDQYDPIYGLTGLVHITSTLGADNGNDLPGGPAQFYSATVPCLVWGGYDDLTFTFKQQGFLQPGGGLLASDVSSTGSVSGTMFRPQSQTLSTGGISKSVNFALGAMAVWPQPAGAGVTLTVTVSTNGVGRGWLIIQRSADTFTTLSVVSPAHASVKIRSGDTALGSGAGTPHTIYEFQSVGTTLYVWKVGAF